MTREARLALKRKVAQALRHVDLAALDLAELHERFDGVHPEYASYLDAIITNLLMSKEFMLDFWEKAWGKRPEHYDAWR